MTPKEPAGPRKRGTRRAGKGRSASGHQGDVIALEFGSDPFGLFKRFRDWAYTISGNADEADDVGMDLAVKVWEKRAENSSYAADLTRIDAFANRATRNALSNQLRADRKHEEIRPALTRHIENHRSLSEDPELAVEGNDLLAVMNRGLLTIATLLRIPWVMRKIDEHPYPYIAKELKISCSIARQRVCRCAVLLQAYVELHWFNLAPEKHT